MINSISTVQTTIVQLHIIRRDTCRPHIGFDHDWQETRRSLSQFFRLYKEKFFSHSTVFQLSRLDNYQEKGRGGGTWESRQRLVVAAYLMNPSGDR